MPRSGAPVLSAESREMPDAPLLLWCNAESFVFAIVLRDTLGSFEDKRRHG